MGYGWGGYANGQIPYDAMIYCRGAYLEPTAAYWAEAMGQVFERERGKPLMFLGYSEGFRVFGNWSDFDNGVRNTQCYYYVRKQRDPGAPAAAYPGGSIHGWALAVDVDLTHLNAGDIEWLHTRGRAFGWNWDTTGKPNDEDWHLDFNLTPTEAFTPNDQTETKDDFMSALTDSQQVQLFDRVNALFENRFDSETWVSDGVKLQPLVIKAGEGERWFLINVEAPLDSTLYRKRVELGPGRLALVKRYFQNDVINETELNIVLNELESVKK